MAGSTTVWVLNGPNLNRLGDREVGVYGDTTYAELSQLLERWGGDLGLHVEVRQTNSEAEMIDWLHAAADSGVAVVMNPAAFTHYSYAIRDACAMLVEPLIEVHISNPLAREEFRHTSVIGGIATGSVSGFGVDSYRLALQALAWSLGRA